MEVEKKTAADENKIQTEPTKKGNQRYMNGYYNMLFKKRIKYKKYHYNRSAGYDKDRESAAE